MQYAQELSIAVAAVRQAALVCRSVQRAIPAAMEKQDKSPVTIADFASQAVICRALGEAFPNDPIIGEEDSAELRLPENKGSLERVLAELTRVGINSSADDVCGWIDRGGAKSFGPRFWTLDPIDGTKGFLRGEQYAISLALIVDGKIAVAILGCPNLPLEPGGAADAGTIFFAVRGQGASVRPCFLPLPPGEGRGEGASRSQDIRATDAHSTQNPHPAFGHPLPLGEGRGEGASRSQDIRATDAHSTQNLHPAFGHPLPLGEGRGEGASRSQDIRATDAHSTQNPHPAFGHPLPEGEGRKVCVSSTSTWADVRLCESVESGHSAHDRSAMISASLGIVKPPVRLDSQAKYAVVARGEGDVYLRLPTKKDYREKIWDHAGGVLIVEEAGGRVTDIDGKPLEFTHGRELSANRGVVVTNGRLHDDVLRAIREHAA